MPWARPRILCNGASGTTDAWTGSDAVVQVPSTGRRYGRLLGVQISRVELDELLRRADEARLKLRRATLELATLGSQLMDARARRDDRRSR